MSKGPELRLRFPVDDHVLSELHARAFDPPSTPESIDVQPWCDRLQRYSVAWVGAFLDEELVGFVHACWDGGLHAFLLDTVVTSEHRRQGLGSRLLRVLIDEVRQAGCEWLHVDFEPHLEAFYRASGFEPTTAGLIHLNK